MPALIDSGASGTLLPPFVTADLGLRKIGERKMSGAFGPPRFGSIYVVNLDFLGFIFRDYPAAVSPEERAYALVGRDVLNRYLTTLNGPSEELSVAGNALR